MQELIQNRKIIDDEKKQVILEILADKYCKLILHSTLEKPKSAMEISNEKKIPISTVYRRLQTLFDAKLLSISGSINQDGKKYFLYKSRVKSISLKCDLEVTTIELESNFSRVKIDFLICIWDEIVEQKFLFGKKPSSFIKKRIYKKHHV